MIKFKEAQEFGDSLARFFPDPNNKLVKYIGSNYSNPQPLLVETSTFHT